MASLKAGERHHKCESNFHSRIRLQESYIVRNFHNELEQKFCQGCLGYLHHKEKVQYNEKTGYSPVGMTIEELVATHSWES